jgi:hypothetical protein
MSLQHKTDAQLSNFNKNSPPIFNDVHNLRPSGFPNGCVCGHLCEIRCINFDMNKNLSNMKMNVQPVNIKIRSSW